MYDRVLQQARRSGARSHAEQIGHEERATQPSFVQAPHPRAPARRRRAARSMDCSRDQRQADSALGSSDCRWLEQRDADLPFWAPGAIIGLFAAQVASIAAAINSRNMLRHRRARRRRPVATSSRPRPVWKTMVRPHSSELRGARSSSRRACRRPARQSATWSEPMTSARGYRAATACGLASAKRRAVADGTRRPGRRVRLPGPARRWTGQAETLEQHSADSGTSRPAPGRDGPLPLIFRAFL